ILASFRHSSEVSEAILPRLYLIVKWKNPRLRGLRYRVTGCRTRRCLASIGTAVEGFHGESSLQGLTWLSSKANERLAPPNRGRAGPSCRDLEVRGSGLYHL